MAQDPTASDVQIWLMEMRLVEPVIAWTEGRRSLSCQNDFHLVVGDQLSICRFGVAVRKSNHD
jgi:hypothetical protein